MHDRADFTLAAAVLFFVLAVCFLNYVVPPFQNPDEPNHFAGIMVYALGESDHAVVEREVIRMMAANNWWRHVGMGTPHVLPQRLADIPFLMGGYRFRDFKERLAGIRFYHLFLGRMFRFLGVRDIPPAYYACRLVSAIFGLGALVFLFLALRLFGRGPRGFLLPGLFFVLFLPQFLVGTLAVNSDAAANFLGGLFFWAAASLLTGKGKKNLLFTLLLAAAVLGFLVDRSSFTLVPLALLVPFFLVKKKRYRESIVDLLTFLVVFLFSGILAIRFFPLLADNNLRMFGLVCRRFSGAAPVLFSLGEGSLEFLTFIADSFLLKFGWAVFGVGAGVYYAWRLAVTVSFAGVFVFLGQKAWSGAKAWPVWMEKLQRGLGLTPSAALVHRRIRYLRQRETPAGSGGGTGGKAESPGSGIPARMVVFFGVAFLFQLLAAWTYYGSRMLAQGRHFFPLLIPVALLFVLGMKSFFGAVRPRAAGIAVALFLLAEFVLLQYAVWARMLPYFHLVIKSPYPGL